MASTDRNHRLHMLLSETEQGMLNDLADAKETTVSDCVRQLLRDAHRAMYPNGKPKKTAKRASGAR